MKQTIKRVMDAHGLTGTPGIVEYTCELLAELSKEAAPVIASEKKPEEKDNAELDIDSNNAGTEQQRELDGKVEMGQLLDDSPNPTAGDSEIKRNLLLIGDGFRGDDLKLATSIEALIALNDSGALVPHGIGGHARSLLACAALRLLTSPPNTADIEQRTVEAIAHWIRCGDHHGVITSDDVLAGKWKEYL